MFLYAVIKPTSDHGTMQQEQQQALLFNSPCVKGVKDCPVIQACTEHGAVLHPGLS